MIFLRYLQRCSDIGEEFHAHVPIKDVVRSTFPQGPMARYLKSKSYNVVKTSNDKIYMRAYISLAPGIKMLKSLTLKLHFEALDLSSATSEMLEHL